LVVFPCLSLTWATKVAMVDFLPQWVDTMMMDMDDEVMVKKSRRFMGLATTPGRLRRHATNQTL
jgi:hypothetical protein